MNNKDNSKKIKRLDEIMLKTAQKLNEKLDGDFELTPQQFVIMVILQRRNEITSSDLAKELNVKPSAITAIIDRMIKNNFVKRKRNEKDRRIVWICMTNEGQTILKETNRKREKIFKSYLSQFSEEEMNQMIKLSEKLFKIIEEEGE